MKFAEVLLEVSIGKKLDYRIPEELQVSFGSLVEVPLRRGFSRGIVAQIKETSDFPNAKPIHSVLQKDPVLTQDLFSLAEWIMEYYCAPLEKVLKTMLPAGVRKATELKVQYLVVRSKSRDEIASQINEVRKRAPQQASVLDEIIKARGGLLLTELEERTGCHASSVKSLVEKGFIHLEKVRTDRSLLENEEYFKTKPKILRGEQQVALDAIYKGLDSNTFSPYLLLGVTGSGKTEVYMQAIKRALDSGKSVLMLVPEIALTTQTIHRFKARFDVPIAVLHHRLSDGERRDMWAKIQNGTCPIALGARSSVFAPLQKLGLIIVDEEHESSYKQNDDSPCYNARDVALMRAKLSNSAIILGSATPSIESFFNAKRNKYELLTLFERSTSFQLPHVHIVDMRREFEKAKSITPFSELLLNKIEQRVATGEQTILFLNRRGFHTICRCASCFTTIKCSSCDTALTFHKKTDLLACHLCGFEMKPPRHCPSCKADSVLQYRGVGTEKIEAALHAIFPNISTLRIDADTTKHKGTLEKLISDFRSGKADVMIGTQMIAKGLHFPDVSLVGVLNCDTALNIPDYRSQEQVFQLITQVAGRSGRGFSQGEVILQTTVPENSTINAAKEQDYFAFYEEEIAIRKAFNYPPFTRFTKFLFSGPSEQVVSHTATQWAEELKKILPESCFCHEAQPCGHPKIQDRYRYQVLVRSSSSLIVSKAAIHLMAKIPLPAHVMRFIDVDAISTFF